MKLDAQAVINEITRQRNEALGRCAVLASEVNQLRQELARAKREPTILEREDDGKEKGV